MKRVIFTPWLIWQLWLQRGHCEKAQSHNSFRKLTDERGSETEPLSSLSSAAHTFSHGNTPHTTNFDKLVDFYLVVACGGEDLKYFLENAGRNAMYTSHIAVV